MNDLARPCIVAPAPQHTGGSSDNITGLAVIRGRLGRYPSAEHLRSGVAGTGAHRLEQARGGCIWPICVIGECPLSGPISIGRSRPDDRDSCGCSEPIGAPDVTRHDPCGVLIAQQRAEAYPIGVRPGERHLHRRCTARLEAAEPLGQLAERGAVAQGAGLALHDAEVVAPVVDSARRPVVAAGEDPAMLGDDAALGRDHDPFGAGTYAHRAVGEGGRHAVAVALEGDEAGREARLRSSPPPSNGGGICIRCGRSSAQTSATVRSRCSGWRIVCSGKAGCAGQSRESILLRGGASAESHSVTPRRSLLTSPAPQSRIGVYTWVKIGCKSTPVHHLDVPVLKADT
jgi:hypothetical protein